MGIFSKLFSKPAAEDPEVLLRRYIDEKLPKGYVSSPKYAVDIRGEGDKYAARLTLDMTADGSDYSEFSVEDYLNLSELEGSYILEECLNAPPVPAEFTLNLLFDDRGMALLKEHYAKTQACSPNL